MKRIATTRSTSRDRRRGLAPLEFVMALPIIITIAALMYVVGAAGLVKSRAQAAARYANWRTSSIRQGGGDPQPRNWSSPATIFPGGGGSLDGTNSLWENSGLTAARLRGPVTDEMQRGFYVGADVHSGNAHFRRPLPMLEPVTGREKFDVQLEQQVLADAWEFHQGPFGLPNNRTNFYRIGNTVHRHQIETRGDRWYEFDQDGLFPTMENARDRLVNANLVGLDALDRDQELIDAYGFPPTDFHPRFSRSGWEGSARSTLFGPAFERHLENVARVPGRMANAFIGLYNSQLSSLNAQRNALLQAMPRDPRAIAAVEDQIAAVQAKLDPMQRFRNNLPRRNR